MQFTVIMRALERTPEKKELAASLLKDEAKIVWELQKKGFIRSISFIKGESNLPEGVVISIEANNKEIVEAEMNKFPFAYNKISEFEVFEHAPFTSLETLFGE